MSQLEVSLIATYNRYAKQNVSRKFLRFYQFDWASSTVARLKPQSDSSEDEGQVLAEKCLFSFLLLIQMNLADALREDCREHINEGKLSSFLTKG